MWLPPISSDPSIAVAALGIGPKDLINDLNTMGLLFETMCVRDLRVYAESLGIKVFSGLMKPFSGPLKKLIQNEGFKKEEVVLIGDQVLTDVKAGNGAGIMTILTEPISKGDIIWTRFNRVFEKKKRKKILSETYNLIGR